MSALAPAPRAPLGPGDPLFDAALAAHANAHAPYSGFAVGAAVRSEEGRIFAGCNVENASYPEGTCAETGAIATMIAAGGRRIAEVLVLAEGTDPVPPCGGCRQRIIEFADPVTPVILAGPEGERSRTTLGALLPGPFSGSDLGLLRRRPD
jgi:cytidine deaminase